MSADLYQDFVGAPASPALHRAAAGDDDTEVRLARARGKARAEGFADGASSTQATFDREMLGQINAVSEALTHFAADRETADATSIDALRRILSGALAAFAPSLASATLPTLVADTMAKALTADMAGAVVVETTAERMPDLKKALSGRDVRLSFSEDPYLGPGAARIVWRGGFDHVDASAPINAGAALLDERLQTLGPPNADATTDANKKDQS